MPSAHKIGDLVLHAIDEKLGIVKRTMKRRSTGGEYVPEGELVYLVEWVDDQHDIIFEHDMPYYKSNLKKSLDGDFEKS